MAPSAAMKFDTATISSLEEWHDGYMTSARTLWEPLEAFFLSQGYILWRSERGDMHLELPNESPRTFDGYAYMTHYDLPTDTFESRFMMPAAISCAARTTDNRDVVIHMIMKNNHGENHRAALSRLATDDKSLTGKNHTVPILQELVYDDMIFAVFLMMHTGFPLPWYYCFSEVLDAVEQVLEGINFCHKRLVAHRDLHEGKILIPWIRGKNQPPESFFAGGAEPVAPFRSLFPIRYYQNDFKFAVTFDKDSDPASRVVVGIPRNVRLREGTYPRTAAPEMEVESKTDPTTKVASTVPYCPFRADIWMLGNMFNDHFGHLGYISQPLVDLFEEMLSPDPHSRPAASAALHRVREMAESPPNVRNMIPPPWYKVPPGPCVFPIPGETSSKRQIVIKLS